MEIAESQPSADLLLIGDSHLARLDKKQLSTIQGTVLNCATAGSNSFDLLVAARLLAALHAPAAALSAGSNDAASWKIVDCVTFERHLDDACSYLRGEALALVLPPITPTDPLSDPRDVRPFKEAIARVAARYAATLIDLEFLVRSDDAVELTDGVHMNSLGQARLCSELRCLVQTTSAANEPVPTLAAGDLRS